MTCFKHGISIGMQRIENNFFMTLVIIGKLTHQDYEMIAPVIDSALEGVKEPKIRLFVDVTQLEGWELRAAWDDFKVGLKHGNQFDRIALLGNKKWQEWATKVGSWFVSGGARYFENESEALQWLQT